MTIRSIPARHPRRRPCSRPWFLMFVTAFLAASWAERAEPARAPEASPVEREDTLWTNQLQDFFGEKKPFNVYTVQRDGRWVAGLCTATNLVPLLDVHRYLTIA